MVEVTVEIKVPEEMVPFISAKNKHDEIERNAMLLYPYVQKGMVSFGKAAEILGIHKLDALDLYGELGLAYFDQTADALEEDLETFQQLTSHEVSA